MSEPEIVEVITEDEAIARGLLHEVEPWMQELFERPFPMFAHIPSAGLPFRYVGTVASAQGLLVICSAARERDDKRWLHVSMSRHQRLPSYRDMKLIKDTFVGRDRVALQVFPRANEYVNISPYALHLWSCLDGEPVPDFRHEGQI